MSRRLSKQDLLSRTSSRQAWGWQWWVLREWDEVFDRHCGLSWSDLARTPGARLIKHNALRSVWRVPAGDRELAAKLYQPRRGWDRVKTAVLGPPGKQEFLAALYGKILGLKTARPVAYGQPLPGAATAVHVLLLEYFDGSAPLSSAWLEAGGAGRRRTSDDPLIAGVARFLEGLHAAGLVPCDLHPQNILVRDSQNIVLVDLHKARHNVRVGALARYLNLADLNQWFQRNASRSDRLRFLLAYLTFAFERPGPLLVRRYVQEVHDATEWKARRLERKRDRRIFGDNRYFGVLSLPDRWTAHVYLQAKRPIAGSPCSTLRFERSMWRSALQQVIAGDRSGDTLRVGGHDLAVVIETEPCAPNGLRERWQRGHMEINRHRPGALPLAFLERPDDGGAESILIVERRQTP